MRLTEVIRPANSKPGRNRNPGGLKLSQPSQPHIYHGANVLSLAMIFLSDSLEEGAYWGKRNEPYGVRCTRSQKIAAMFAWGHEEIPFGGIIALDWHKIVKRWKTVEYVDTSYEGDTWEKDEEEEVILTRAVKPLSTYLVDIKLNRKITMKVVQQAWEYGEAYHGDFIKRFPNAAALADPLSRLAAMPYVK